jgi:hypothetical protein
MPLNLLQRKVISYHYHRDWMTLQGQTLMGQKLPDNHDQTNVLVKDAKMIFQVNFLTSKQVIFCNGLDSKNEMSKKHRECIFAIIRAA